MDHPFKLAIEDPRTEDLVVLLRRHLDEMRAISPEGCVLALDVEGLCAPEVTLWAARVDGVAVACGALKELDSTHAEIKSVHTHSEWRGMGIARRFVERLIEEACGRGYRRLSLETGSTEPFRAARHLYGRLGFEPADHFGDYEPTEHSAFMSKELGS